MSKPNNYLDYVYDFESRTFKNQFEDMYRECECPWPHQVEMDDIQYRFVLECVRKQGRQLRILDVGCGLGYFSNVLRMAGTVTAVDISPTCVGKAATAFPEVTFEALDIAKPLPWPAASFDCIVVLGVLWFVLEKIDDVLLEFSRVLAPSGEAIFGLNIPENPIGGEIIATDQDYYDIVSRYFHPKHVFSTYFLQNTTELRKGDKAVYLYCTPK